MYLNVFVPGLRYERGIVGFFREHRGQPLPSAALMSPMTRTFVAKLEDFVVRHGIALVQFCPGQRKDAVMAEHLRRFDRDEGIVFIGKAQLPAASVLISQRIGTHMGRQVLVDAGAQDEILLFRHRLEKMHDLVERRMQPHTFRFDPQLPVLDARDVEHIVEQFWRARAPRKAGPIGALRVDIPTYPLNTWPKSRKISRETTISEGTPCRLHAERC